jgi:hypothetical protein
MTRRNPSLHTLRGLPWPPATDDLLPAMTTFSFGVHKQPALVLCHSDDEVLILCSPLSHPPASIPCRLVGVTHALRGMDAYELFRLHFIFCLQWCEEEASVPRSAQSVTITSLSY